MSSAAATKRRSDEATKGSARARGGFTLVELLVVIVVIGVLVGLLVMFGGRVVGGQKAATTRSTMQTVRMAIDQFATEDPLRATYNNPKLRHPQGGLIGRTFGPYPPYQLKNAGAAGTVPAVLEPAHGAYGQLPATLTKRLAWDLSGARADQSITDSDWAWLNDEQNEPKPGDDYRHLNDMRALYAYLAVYAAGALAQIPEAAIKPLVPGSPEFVNPTGQGTDSGDPGLIDVFGIHDAWGVPLDYFLYVKLEYKIGPDGVNRVWMVTDRVPVLRSRGVSREEFDAAVQAAKQGDLTLLEGQRGNWILSDPFPQPAAGVNPDTGALLGNDARFNGWAWAVPQKHDEDTYIPAGPP